MNQTASRKFKQLALWQMNSFWRRTSLRNFIPFLNFLFQVTKRKIHPFHSSFYRIPVYPLFELKLRGDQARSWWPCLTFLFSTREPTRISTWVEPYHFPMIRCPWALWTSHFHSSLFLSTRRRFAGGHNEKSWLFDRFIEIYAIITGDKQFGPDKFHLL